MAKRKGGKRAKGEGTIYYSKARGKWVAQLPPGSDGRRHLRTAATEAEALKLLRQMRAESEAGRSLTRQAETVKDLLDDWLETMQPVVRSSTYKHYHAGCQHIIDRVGKVRAQDVTIEMVQRIANDLTASGLGPATVKAALSRLRAAYERLIPERYSSNPVNWRKLKLRKVRAPERRPVDVAHVRKMLYAITDIEARGRDARWAAAVWLAALLGMRRGEIMGLRWADVDWEKSLLRVQQQRNQRGTIAPLKTEESRRDIPIGSRLRELLRATHEMHQAEEKHRPNWEDHDLVVCNEDGKPPKTETFRNLLNRLTKTLDIPHIHPHLLRHTMATMLDELGYSETIIGAILGHTTGASITRRYTHARIDRVRRAVEAVEKYVFEG